MLKFNTIGADPEVFLTKDGEVVPCVGIIGGEKQDAIQITEDLGVLEDNVLLEWNMSPSTSKKQFSDKCAENITIIREQVVPKGYGIEIKDFHDFYGHDLSSEQASEFGCQPDFNAYTMKINKSPNPKSTFRAAGGHIHIGFGGIRDQWDLVELVRLCDAVIGTYCVINEDYSRRRKLYGGAGSFREKPYGFEYRTPSNFWVDSREHSDKIFDLVNYVIDLYNVEKFVPADKLGVLEGSINEHDSKKAEKIYNKYINYIKDVQKVTYSSSN